MGGVCCAAQVKVAMLGDMHGVSGKAGVWAARHVPEAAF